jgi:hypothetical protein
MAVENELRPLLSDDGGKCLGVHEPFVKRNQSRYRRMMNQQDAKKALARCPLQNFREPLQLPGS